MPPIPGKRRDHLPPAAHEFVAMIDASDATTTTRCERCGRALRWVCFLLSPDDVPVYAGRCCASRLVVGSVDLEAEETAAKNRAERLQRFLNPRLWGRTKSSGNPIRKIGKAAKTLVVLSRNAIGEWRFGVKRPKQPWADTPYRTFATQREAAVAAFDWLDANGETRR